MTRPSSHIQYLFRKPSSATGGVGAAATTGAGVVSCAGASSFTMGAGAGVGSATGAGSIAGGTALASFFLAFLVFLTAGFCAGVAATTATGAAVCSATGVCAGSAATCCSAATGAGAAAFSLGWLAQADKNSAESSRVAWCILIMVCSCKTVDERRRASLCRNYYEVLAYEKIMQ